MFMNNWYGGGIYVKFAESSLHKGQAAFEKIYRQSMPGAVYEFDYLDEANQQRYAQEQRWQYIITVATVLSMLICALGLFGLAHIATQQKVKEIGVRKVLGASVTQILMLLSGQFLRLVFIAFLVAAPAAWIVMNRWLQDFAYRINLGIGIFIIAAITAVTMALAAISLQSIKTARSNPVKSLKGAS
jgi:putative ABC transport system permease protein